MELNKLEHGAACHSSPLQMFVSLLSYYLTPTHCFVPVHLFFFSFTVEDPSYDFLRLRDYVDALACINLSAFSQENLLNGFSGEMVKEAQEKLKINKVRSFICD